MAGSYCVYCYTNTLNGKKYVGQTKNAKYRCRPNMYKGCTKFHNAIQKYGYDSFTFEILEDGLSKEEANDREIQYIEFFDCIRNGYNLKTGGDSWEFSEESKERMRRSAHKRKIICLESREVYDSSVDAERKTGLAATNISTCCSKPGYTIGGFHFQYLDDFLDDTILTTLRSNAKKVYCVELDRLFNSISEAERITGANNVGFCCNGGLQTSGGYHWRRIDDTPSVHTIDIGLDPLFAAEFDALYASFGSEFAALNGLDRRTINYSSFIDNFVDKGEDAHTVSDVSIDGSANVFHKDIVTLDKEMNKPHKKLLAFNKIFYEINKQYGYPIAKRWLEFEWSRSLYLHDSNSSSMVPYCYAYTLKRLAEEGQFFQENYNNQPPKHLDTFIDFVKEFVSYTSNRTSGACGLPDLIPYMYFFWREDVKNHHMGLTEEYAEKYAKQNIQRFIYAVNQTYVRDNCQSAFTNTSVFDRPYLTALFGGATFPDGSLMIDDIEGIIQFQKWYMEEMSAIHEDNMFTFPVNTISLLKKNGKFVDDEFARWSTRHNMVWMDSNIFCSSEVTSLSNCCRLKSDIQNLGFFNSVGGTSLRVGSVKVSTINLARIALETEDEASYLERLKEVTFIDLIVLDIVRHIIQRNIDKHLLPNYCDGMIDIKTQYNTVGVLGVYEVMKTFGYIRKDEFGNVFYTDDAMRFGKQIFETIQSVIDDFRKDKDYMINIEQVPGEQAAVKFMKADVMLYPEKAVVDLPLYGNQFIPLGIKTTLQERIRISSVFDEYCNGGSITHINVESPFKDFDQMWDMLNYITDKGVTYFAFTSKIQACKHNHAFFGKVCPKCGEPVATNYARIVGFFTPLRTWSSERKAEGLLREWMKPEDVCISENAVENIGILN